VVSFIVNKQTKPLSVKALAQLFLQLAQLESSGLSPVQALGLLDSRDKMLQPRLLMMCRQLQTGSEIVKAGVRAGVFDDSHKALIEAAEGSGKLTAVYRQLAIHYQGLSKRLKTLRSRLYLPALILVLALLLQPLPALAIGGLSGGHFVVRVFSTLTVIALCGLVAMNLSGLLEKAGLKTGWDRVLLQLPWIGGWLTARQLNEFHFILALLLDAGLVFSDALPKAVATVRNRVLRAQFAPAVEQCHSGVSVVETLRLVTVIKPLTLQVVASGEQSGRLADSLLHLTQIEAESIALQEAVFAEWLPRLVYWVIIGWLTYSILTSGAFLPK
jgi:general secretion pathway protein F